MTGKKPSIAQNRRRNPPPSIRRHDKPLTKSEMQEMLKRAVEQTPSPEDDDAE